jgi:hypothetical protein
MNAFVLRRTVMADTGSVAALLHEFIEMVDKEAGESLNTLEEARDGMQRFVSEPKPGRYKKGLLEVCEQRLAKLKSEDRDEFHRLLRAMHEAS